MRARWVKAVMVAVAVLAFAPARPQIAVAQQAQAQQAACGEGCFYTMMFQFYFCDNSGIYGTTCSNHLGIWCDNGGHGGLPCQGANIGNVGADGALLALVSDETSVGTPQRDCLGRLTVFSYDPEDAEIVRAKVASFVV